MYASLTPLIPFPAVDVDNFALTTTGMLENEKQLFEYNLAFCWCKRLKL